MAEMTIEMMNLINNMAAPYLATASKEGVPNVVPCGSTRAINPDTITITALHLNKTFRNLEENPKVALVFHSELGKKGERREVRGWQIKGEATLVNYGEYYERAKEGAVKRFGEEAAKMVKAAVVIRVKEIYNIASGPDAGKRAA
jgi:predicted pyridoxine 5'-phosphate oxidase superfamily flavin-nucleotide-binding protein